MGTVRLGLTKSDKSRFWALDAGVIAALRAYRKLREPVGPLDRVFVGPDGDVIVKNGATATGAPPPPSRSSSWAPSCS